jgi:predicted Zn-dependent peptidase
VIARRLEELDLHHYESRLDSGLTVSTLVLPQFAKTYAMLGVRYGSMDTRVPAPGASRPIPAGTAHFLEHRLFESTDGNVMDRFAALGASYNAFTDYFQTAYLFSATSEEEACLDHLLTFVQHPHLTAAGVDKERGIIVQELRMYRDMPEHRSWHALLNALYHLHPVRQEIGGSEQSVAEITADLLIACHQAFYRPSNMRLVVVGDVDPKAVVAQAERAFPTPSGPAPAFAPPAEPPTISQERVETTMAVSVPILEIGFKDRDPSTDLGQETATGLMAEALFGESSDLYLELHRQGLITDGFGAQSFTGPGFGLVAVGGETIDPERLEGELWRGIETIRKNGLDHTRVDRLRRRQIGQFWGLFDRPEALAHAWLGMAFQGQDLFELPDLLESITVTAVDERLTLLDPAQAAVSVVRDAS